MMGILVLAVFPHLLSASPMEQVNNVSRNESRLKIFSMEYHHVQEPFEITLCIMLASFAKIGKRWRDPGERLCRHTIHGGPGAPALGHVSLECSGFCR